MDKQNELLINAFIEKPSIYEIDVNDASMLPKHLQEKDTLTFSIKPPSLEVLAKCAIPSLKIPEEIRNSEKPTFEDIIKYRNEIVEILSIMAHNKKSDYPKWYTSFFLNNLTPKEMYLMFYESFLKSQTGFFFELFPDCKPEKSNDTETKLNPYRYIGSVCNYWGFTYDFAVRGISFQNLMLLSASIPNHKSEEEKPKTLTGMLKSLK